MTTRKPTRVFIALGANLGDREANLREALKKLLETPGVEVEQISTFFENPAVGGPPDSPPFLNAAAELTTTLAPRELLNRLLDIEQEMGRSRAKKWDPRLIDLDILLYGNEIIVEPDLTIPHPLMGERRFVLMPLAEIAPDVPHPAQRQPIWKLLYRLDTKVHRYSYQELEPEITVDLPCARCEYNLRGLRSDGQCPECGSKIQETINLLVEKDSDLAARFGVRQVAARAKCTVDAVLFVQAAVGYLARTMASNTKLAMESKHVRANEVCDAIRDYALQYFNDKSEAMDLLAEWGINTSEDVGRIIFASVEAGLMAKAEDDKIEQFNGLFTLKELFA